MRTRNIFLRATLLLSICFFVSHASACGCGLALSEMKVFNALKETQAYLLIDIHDSKSYDEMPFFRMVSMDEPYNVTIVFPIDGIPYDVEGKKITAGEFLDKYGIRAAEENMIKQSFEEAVKKVGSDLKETSSTAFLLSNGIFATIFFTANYFGATGAYNTDGMRFAGGLNPVAHFEFEGGSLDIYDVKSMETLEGFVKTINITLTGDVEKLVTKYNKYYVAVLYLNVPSAIDADSRQMLKSCPGRTETVKRALTEKTSFNYRETDELAGNDECSEPLRRLINSVTNVDSSLNGTLVMMKFRDTDSFFYPTSIVNSYKYPITDQKYFIRTPTDLHIDLESSAVDKTANAGSGRWYEVSSTEEDIKGKIVPAGIDARLGDMYRSFNQTIYDNSGLSVIIIYLLIIVLPLAYYLLRVKEGHGLWNAVMAVLLFLIGGLLLSSLGMFLRKKRMFALTLSIIWLMILTMSIIF